MSYSTVAPNATPAGYVAPTWFDQLPALLRHTLFSILGTLLALGLPWLQTHYTTLNLPVGGTAVLGMFLPVIIAWATPLTSQYGTVSKRSIVPFTSVADPAPYVDPSINPATDPTVAVADPTTDPSVTDPAPALAAVPDPAVPAPSTQGLIP